MEQKQIITNPLLPKLFQASSLVKDMSTHLSNSPTDSVLVSPKYLEKPRSPPRQQIAFMSKNKQTSPRNCKDKWYLDKRFNSPYKVGLERYGHYSRLKNNSIRLKKLNKISFEKKATILEKSRAAQILKDEKLKKILIQKLQTYQDSKAFVPADTKKTQPLGTTVQSKSYQSHRVLLSQHNMIQTNCLLKNLNEELQKERTMSLIKPSISGFTDAFILSSNNRYRSPERVSLSLKKTQQPSGLRHRRLVSENRLIELPSINQSRKLSSPIAPVLNLGSIYLKSQKTPTKRYKTEATVPTKQKDLNESLNGWKIVRHEEGQIFSQEY